jgi:hypothetical protein
VENSIGRGYMGYEFCLGCEDEHNSPIVGQILLANGVSLEDFVEEVNRGAIRVTLNRGRLMIQGCHLNLGQLLDAAAECMKRQIPAA